MKIAFTIFLYGKWILRSTNDYNLKQGITYLDIKDENTIEVETRIADHFFEKRAIRYGTINRLGTAVDVDLHSKITYPYSLFGTEIFIPKLDQGHNNYDYKKKFIIKQNLNKLCVTDVNSNHYYLWETYNKESSTPKIETKWNNFIFLQIITFLLNIIFAQSLHIFHLETNN